MKKVTRRLYIDGSQESLDAIKKLTPHGISFKIVDTREMMKHEFDELPTLLSEEGEFCGVNRIRIYAELFEATRWGSEKGK